MDDRKIVYNLKGLEDERARRSIERLVGEIKGVERCKCSLELQQITLVLDEWASEYDVLRSVMDAVENNGAEIDFSEAEGDSSQNSAQPETAQPEQTSEATQAEEQPESDGATEESAEAVSDDGADGEKDKAEKDKEAEEEDDLKVPLIKKYMSPLIELGISVIALLVGLIFFDEGSNVQGIFIVVAFALAGYEIIWDAFAKIFKKKFFSEELLMVITSVACLLLGEYEEAAMLMILFRVGGLLEGYSVDKSNRALDKLLNFKNQACRVVRGEGFEEIKAKDVAAGELICVRSGERVLLDCVVVSGGGRLEADSAIGARITQVKVGDGILGGGMVTDGEITCRTERVYSESAAAKTYETVSGAREKKTERERFISRFAKIYTPSLLILAVLIAFIPPLFSIGGIGYGKALVGTSGSNGWIYNALVFLCVACPCALVISVPLTYFSAVGYGAKRGILIKGCSYLEDLAEASAVVFDEQGTLTEKGLTVKKVISENKFKGKTAAYAAAVGAEMSGEAFAAVCREKKGGAEAEAIECEADGCCGNIGGAKVVCGSAEYLSAHGVSVKTIFEGDEVLYLAVDGEFAGAIVLEHKMREHSRGAVRELKDTGVKVIMVSDGTEAERRAQELKIKRTIDVTDTEGLVPAVETCKDAGKIVYVGNGSRCAHAADDVSVSVAMGEVGSEAALGCSDVVIINDEVANVPHLIKLAKRTRSIVKQNIIISIAVKFLILGVTVLLGALTDINILWPAVLADEGVLAVCVLNSFRNYLKVY